MFYRDTQWAERHAAHQANLHMPGLQRQADRPIFEHRRRDFETGSEFFWFYMHYFIFSICCLLTLALIVLDIGLYVKPPHNRTRADWRPLVLSLLPVS